VNKVLLVYPPGRRLDWQASLPCLSGYLKERGFDVRVVDCTRVGVEEFFDVLEWFEPDVVGVSIPFTPFAPSAYDLIERIRGVFDGLVVAGGVHASLCWEEVLEHVDVVFRGEGEESFTRFLRGEVESRVVDGVSVPLDDLPFPDWGCVDAGGFNGCPPVTSSRGCPFECNFCANHVLCGRRIRYCSAERSVREMEWLHECFGVSYFVLRDEVFTLNVERVKRFCGLVEGKGFFWECQTRVNLVGEDLLVRMRESGCVQVGVGVESGNQEILDRIPKHLTKSEIREGVGLIKRCGLRVSTGFIVGHPWDTLETVRESVVFADELDPDSAGFAVMTPYPGTRVREQALRDGGIVSDDWSEYYTTHVTYVPPGLRDVNLKCLRLMCEARFNRKSLRRLRSRAGMHFPSFLRLLPLMLVDFLVGDRICLVG